MKINFYFLPAPVGNFRNLLNFNFWIGNCSTQISKTVSILKIRLHTYMQNLIKIVQTEIIFIFTKFTQSSWKP